jgi:DNA helicase HerA-like ATPase/FixJ family two-component response regulator
MESENILLIDDKSEPLKPVFNLAASKVGFNMLYADSVADGYNLLDRNSDNISAIILDLLFAGQPKQGEEALIDLRNKFPDIPVVVLTESYDNTRAAIRCIKNGAYDFMGKSSLDTTHLFHVVGNAVNQNKLTRRIKHRLNKLPEVNYPAIHYSSDDITCKFAYKLNSISMQTDANLLDNLMRSSGFWHYNLLNIILSSYRENVIASLIIRKRGEKPVLDFHLVFTLTESNNENLKTLVDEFIAATEPFVFSIHESYTKPYIFETVTDPDILNSILAPKFNNPAIRLYNQPECWGVLGEYNLEDADPNESLKAEFLPVLPNGKNFTNYNLLFQSLLATSGSSVLTIHLQPLRLRYNEKEFLDKIIDGEIVLSTEKIGDSLDDHISRFKELVNSTLNNYLFEVRFMSDIHSNIPKLLDVELTRHFYTDTSIVKSTFQSGLFDNIFSISANRKLSRLSFFKTSKEVSLLFSFPLPGNKFIKGIPYQNSSLQIIPANIADTGLLLGEKNLGGERIDIRINNESLKKHMYILGQTGTGKTTLLKTMIQEAIKANNGFCVIDPHGDLFEDVLAMIPNNRKKDVVLFDTNNIEGSAKLNFFMPGSFFEKSMVVEELLRILASEYDMKLAGGPMFETYFRSTLNLILHPKIISKYKTPTIQLAYKALLIPKFLRHLLNLIKSEIPIDDTGIDFSSESISDLESEILFDIASLGKGEMEWDTMRPYIYSKMKFFVDNIYIRELFDNKAPDLNFRDIMDNGKILLVRIEKGHIGPSNLTKIGRLFLNKMIFSIMSRAELPVDQRKEFFVFIDEFQNFLDGDIGSALSEVRKFNVGLVLANQTIGQLSDHLFQSVLGNVGSTAFFRTGLNDIGKIRHFFEPDFTTKEIVNLQNFNCVARIMHNNRPSDPFIFQTKLNNE